MNGDLSLSQSLGGLRIANPDDEVRSGASSSPPPHIPSRNQLLSPSSQHQTSRDNAEQDSLPLLDTGAVDVATSLGFDPTAYAFNPQSSPASPRSKSPSVPTTGHSQRLNHRQSMPIAQQAHEQSYYQPPSPDLRYHTPSGRPTSSALHNNDEMSSYPPPPPQQQQPPGAQYQSNRTRAGPSTQNNSGDLRRSQSRAAAAAAMQSGPPPRYPAGRTPPPGQAQMSNPAAFPPRRSSKQGHSKHSPPDAPPLSRSATDPATSPGLETGPLPGTSEEWRERGAAVGVKKVEKDGKISTKVVKKGVKDFNFGRTLGEGSYSTVLAATDRQSSREYAIKVLDKRHIIKEKKVKYVNIEKDTLNRLTDHPGIVRLYYTFQDERSLYFVLDLATGGELLGVLKKTTSFDEDCSRFYAAQILDSVEYMHSRGIIHRDLKPENVLLDDQMHVKITDFGTAKILDIGDQQNRFGQVSVSNDPMDGADTDRAVSFVGTAEYVSPELLTDKNACKASDLWAFGCIVYQLLAGRPPFKAGNEYQTFQKIVNLDYTFPDGFPPMARDLVDQLLVLDPAHRLPIHAIKNHPFFKGQEWGKGLWKQKPPKLRPHRPYADRSNGPPQPSSRPVQDSAPPPISKQVPARSSPPSQPTSTPPSRPQPRIITELAPPSQLDIDWSPVLNRPNERILKLGNLNVLSALAPHSPTSRGGPPSETSMETPSKFSRIFGATTTKKRQRLVMVSSAARLILAPAGGDKKEAKQVIELSDRDVSYRSQTDAKGYTVWCVYTRDRHLTFEDTKTHVGDPGLSTRTTNEWLETLEDAKNHVASKSVPDSYSYSYSDDSGFTSMSPSSQTRAHNFDSVDQGGGFGNPDANAAGMAHSRNILRKGGGTGASGSSTSGAGLGGVSGVGGGVGGDDDSMKGARKRFSKRNSKNGLAAVF
ncbi:MAG: pkb-activating kinase-like protein [Alyxoria varia]|nr:MAG: pkb-activating kinase-like protein [Alyxoria varia]